MEYQRLLFSELRLLVIAKPASELTESGLLKAMTVHEELLELGYTLSPENLLRLAKSPSLNGFAQHVHALMGDVKAKPMYPDFPKQVMDMSEAQFRLHQMLHYFSTYDMELLTGQPVAAGWLPEVQDTEKISMDVRLLTAKTIDLLDEPDKYRVPLTAVLSRNERMTDKERKLVQEAVLFASAEALLALSVPFKQNLLYLFYTVFQSDRETPELLDILQSFCQHTGDVWKCMDYVLTREHYHFRTSQKKRLVKLLERYPAADFQANLILSNKKGSRTNLMLRYLDYNLYSRSEPHRAAVAAFRSGTLRSWESRAKYLLEQKAEGALDFAADRPGMMLRWLTYLLRLGYLPAELETRLLPAAESLRPQTLVSILTHFGDTGNKWDSKERAAEAEQVYAICEALLKKNLAHKETPLHGKQVFLSLDGYSLPDSVIQTNNKSSEGGYVRSGLAYRIPDHVQRLRFFVYWNDKHRVDIDLHASGHLRNGKPIQIGWNSNYKDQGLVFSGDITHSNAAEYIDIDLQAEGKEITCNINIYSGKPCFREIEECFVGMMAVEKLGETVMLYNPANCFFTHFLTGAYHSIHYGYIDAVRRILVFEGAENPMDTYAQPKHAENRFSLQRYLELLLEAQNAVIVSNRSDADCILVMEKPLEETEISLLDNNFFL